MCRQTAGDRLRGLSALRYTVKHQNSNPGRATGLWQYMRLTIFAHIQTCVNRSPDQLSTRVQIMHDGSIRFFIGQHLAIGMLTTDSDHLY